jgi:regulator of RNase E activity RraA
MAHGEVTIVVGGVRVSPGDWIVGDHDGLVIIPADSVEEILAEAEKKVGTENEIRSSVRDGMLPLEAYERYGTF